MERVVWGMQDIRVKQKVGELKVGQRTKCILDTIMDFASNKNPVDIQGLDHDIFHISADEVVVVSASVVKPVRVWCLSFSD